VSGNGPQEGQQNGTDGRGDGSGSTSPGAGTEGQQNGGEGAGGGQGSTLTYSDVINALPEEQRAAVIAEVSKKNSEARTQRQRAKAAEEKLAASGQNGAQQPPEGTQGAGNGNGQQPPAGNGQQQPQEGAQQLAKARHGIAASKIEAIAATAGFADPEDAVRLLDDIASYVDTDFSVDADSIRTDVDALLAKKPHLKRQETPGGGQQRPGRPAPDRSQGSSASGSGGKRTGVDAGRDLYRERHKRPATTS
jgi:hypothetical protein